MLHRLLVRARYLTIVPVLALLAFKYWGGERFNPPT
jgi:hypothetical protein